MAEKHSTVPDNFAMTYPFRYPGEVTDFTCMQCGTTYNLPKILGPDNVYRTLPGACRNCTPAVAVEKFRSVTKERRK